eukprot:CAMPEP_0177757750 /NCGR_PEP_ID=MMETSP0491_2-20121128/3808_1 /TAXON_ID=63592 /ORGANISM="Tetraselmis chuii, Strain PLY429" /LENGTH=942 /DNA_ID=CAMNT_0019273419 /DNA_START=286 /DNA_END=3116 /DNA_ORIENTATION=-
MAAFQASRHLLQELALLRSALQGNEVPDCLVEHVEGWHKEIDGLTDLLNANLFGPTLRLVGRPDVGKTSILNALLGCPLLPPRIATRQATLSEVVDRHQPAVELVSTPSTEGEPRRFTVSLQLLAPEEWLLRKIDLLSLASGTVGTEVQSRRAEELMKSMYGNEWLPLWRQRTVSAAEADTDESAMAEVVEEVLHGGGDSVVEFLESVTSLEVFDMHCLERNGFVLSGSFQSDSAVDRAEAANALRNVYGCAEDAGNATLPPWFQHVVTRVTLKGALGALPSPCTILDCPSMPPHTTGWVGDEEHQPLPSTHACNEHHWMVLSPDCCPEEDPAVVESLQHHLRVDGDLSSLKFVCTKCDDFDADRTAPKVMADAETSMAARLSSMSLVQASRMHLPNRSAPLPGLRVFACSALAHSTLLCESRTDRQRSFLNALGVSSKEDTGVPQLLAELGRVISKAQASLQPALARYASILSSMEARLAHEPPGTFHEAGDGSCASPRDREAMELLFSDLEGGVSAEVDKLESALQCAMREVLEPGIASAEKRLMDCARKEVLPGLQAWRKSAAKGERGSRGEGALFQAVAAQLLGRILAGFKFRRQQLQSRGFDFVADLATSYLGEETGEAQVAAGAEVSEIESEFSLLDYEMDRVWGRLLGSSSNSDARESGRIVQSLRAMYTSVQSQLDAFVAATDNSFEVPTLEVALVNQVHDVAHFRRQGLRHHVHRLSEAAVHSVIFGRTGEGSVISGDGGGGVVELRGGMLGNVASTSLESFGGVAREVSEGVRALLKGVFRTVLAGAQRQLAAMLAGVRRQVAMRGVTRLTDAPTAGAFLMPLLLRANATGESVASALGSPSEQGFGHSTERLREVAAYLMAVCPDDMRQSFHTEAEHEIAPYVTPTLWHASCAGVGAPSLSRSATTASTSSPPVIAASARNAGHDSSGGAP